MERKQEKNNQEHNKNIEEENLIAGSSNSQLTLQSSTNQSNFRIDLATKYGYIHTKIDRITITGRPTEKLIDSFGNSVQLYDNTGLLSEISITRDGEFSSYVGQLFPEKNQNCFVSYEPVKSLKMGDIRPFRMDFNPNKLTINNLGIALRKIIPYLKDIAITRIDFAFDFERDLSNIFVDWFASKREFFDKTGALKTRYYGNEASDYQIVFYDKKQERLNKSTDENEKELFSSFDTLWRIEFRLHNNNFIKNQIKRNFSVLEKQRITTRNYDLLDTLELSAQEKIFIRASDDYPELFKQLGNSTKSKYRKLREQISEIDLTDIFRDTLVKAEIGLGEVHSVNAVEFFSDILQAKIPKI